MLQYYYCSDTWCHVLRQWWRVPQQPVALREEHRPLRLTAVVDLAAFTVCKDHATDCCLVATPCSFPDCRLISDGWLTVLMITFAVGGYLGLGALCACNAIFSCICTKPASASVSFWTTLHSTVYRSS